MHEINVPSNSTSRNILLCRKVTVPVIKLNVPQWEQKSHPRLHFKTNILCCCKTSGKFSPKLKTALYQNINGHSSPTPTILLSKFSQEMIEMNLGNDFGRIFMKIGKEGASAKKRPWTHCEKRCNKILIKGAYQHKIPLCNEGFNSHHTIHTISKIINSINIGEILKLLGWGKGKKRNEG